MMRSWIMGKIDFSNPCLNVGEYPLHMIGIAQSFAKDMKKDFVYVQDSDLSLYFDGKRWRQDKSKTFILEKVMDFSLFLKNIADEMEEENQGKKAEEKVANPLSSIANTLLSPGSWNLFLKAYQLCNYISSSDLDADGSALNDLGLLNCLNCTVDLNTLEDHEHKPSDRLTKLANVQYDPNVNCPEWDTFIDEITCGDKELAHYLQKAFGYSLTTETQLECLFIFYGPKSRNGKSTLLDTILTVLGDYGKSIQPSTIANRGSTNGSAPNSDIARLSGCRLASISEPPEGFNMDTAKVKQITGNDKVTTRFLFQEFFEYCPKFKIFLNTNHLPIIKDDTLFASGRIKVIPFNRHFDEKNQNKGLKQLFRKPENLSAVLNWLLEGLRLFKEEGLDEPQSVKDAIEEYRKSADTTGLFFNSCVEECDNSVNVKRSEFYSEYTRWCNEKGCSILSVKDFNAVLGRKLNVKKLNKNTNIKEGGFYVIGYRLKNTV